MTSMNARYIPNLSRRAMLRGLPPMEKSPATHLSKKTDVRDQLREAFLFPTAPLQTLENKR